MGHVCINAVKRSYLYRGKNERKCFTDLWPEVHELLMQGVYPVSASDNQAFIQATCGVRVQYRREGLHQMSRDANRNNWDVGDQRKIKMQNWWLAGISMIPLPTLPQLLDYCLQAKNMLRFICFFFGTCLICLGQSFSCLYQYLLSPWIYGELRFVLCALIYAVLFDLVTQFIYVATGNNLFNSTIHKLFNHTVWKKALTYQKKIQFLLTMGSYIFSKSQYLTYM